MAKHKKKAAKTTAARLRFSNVVVPLPPKVPVKIHLHRRPVCRPPEHHPWCTGQAREIVCRSMRVGTQILAVCVHAK